MLEGWDMTVSSEVLQDVVVLGVAAEGHVLFVDLYGSSANICASVRFTFPKRPEREAMHQLLDRWAADAVPLTFVRTDSSVALQHYAAGHDDQIAAAS